MIKVFLVDDRRLILEAIKAILEVEPEIAIVGTAQDGKTAVSQAIKLEPDLVLLDLEMPKMDGITATKYITQYLPKTKVIILTSHKEGIYVTKAFRAGASGYIAKDSLVKDLKRAIYSLSRGYCYIESRLLNPAVNQIRASNITSRKTRYLKKYRKHIYSPSIAANPNQSKLVKITTVETNANNSGRSFKRAGLAPISNLSVNRRQQADYSDLAIAYRTKQKRKYYQKLAKRILLISLLILSLILSVILF